MSDGSTCRVDGGVDAIPYLVRARRAPSNENLPERMRSSSASAQELDERYSKDSVLLAEANQWPEDVLQYFGTR